MIINKQEKTNLSSRNSLDKGYKDRKINENEFLIQKLKGKFWGGGSRVLCV